MRLEPDKCGNYWLAISGPWTERLNFYLDATTGEVYDVYKVHSDVDNRTEADIAANKKKWPLVEAGDRKGLESFVDENIVRLIRVEDADGRPIDAVCLGSEVETEPVRQSLRQMSPLHPWIPGPSEEHGIVPFHYGDSA